MDVLRQNFQVTSGPLASIAAHDRRTFQTRDSSYCGKSSYFENN